MILLEDKDLEQFLNLLNQNPNRNLFFKGDYLSYGFGHPDCKFYGFFEGTEMIAILMHYKDALHLTGKALSTAQRDEVFDYYIKHELKQFHTGIEYLELVENFPITAKLDVSTLSVYQKPYKEIEHSGVEILKMEDIDQVIDIQQEAFSITVDREDFKDEHLQGSSITYVKKENGLVLSCATMTALSYEAGMIIGVATIPHRQHEGHAFSVVQCICNDAMKENRNSVLFYTSDIAQELYKKIGFIDQEPYIMVSTLQILEGE